MTDATVHQLPLGSRSTLPPRDERDWVTLHELVDATGITYRQADYWTRTNLLTPLDPPQRSRSGHVRRYHETQVERADVVNQLLAGGMTLQHVRQHIDELLEHGVVELGALTIHYHPNETA